MDTSKTSLLRRSPSRQDRHETTWCQCFGWMFSENCFAIFTSFLTPTSFDTTNTLDNMTFLSANHFYQVSFQIEDIGKNVKKSKKMCELGLWTRKSQTYCNLHVEQAIWKYLIYMANAEVYFEEKKTITFFHWWKSHNGTTNFTF